MFKLTNEKTGKCIELTDSQFDALYSALGDYQDLFYGADETKAVDNVRSKLKTIHPKLLISFKLSNV
jgi:hypothetical protein